MDSAHVCTDRQGLSEEGAAVRRGWETGITQQQARWQILAIASPAKSSSEQRSLVGQEVLYKLTSKNCETANELRHGSPAAPGGSQCAPISAFSADAASVWISWVETGAQHDRIAKDRTLSLNIIVRVGTRGEVMGTADSWGVGMLAEGLSTGITVSPVAQPSWPPWP